MHHRDLFQPRLSRVPVSAAFPERLLFDETDLPASERACEREAVWLDESVFRAGLEGVDDAVAALRTVYDHRQELAVRLAAFQTAAPDWLGPR